jgi:P pilus assembly chaperone PapD
MIPLPTRSLLVVLALALGAASPAAAQLGVDRSEIFIRPAVAAERVGVITVTNTGDRAVQAVVKSEDWDRSDVGANRWYKSGTVKGSCGPALTVFPLSLSLERGASQSIRLVLDDAAAASMSRECWSAVILETVQPPSQSGGVSYVLRTAVKVYVEPAGLQSGGQVTDMRVIEHGGADSLEVAFQNAGERHYVAKGFVEFRRADNSVVAKVDLPEYYVLPGARQRAIVPMPKLPAGEYVAISMVDYGGDEIAAMQIEHTVGTRR